MRLIDVSNRTLTILLSIAIFVTIGGIATILSELGVPISFISGAPTTVNGTVTASIQATTSIALVGATVSFGSGVLDGTSSTTNINTSDFDGVANVGSFLSPGPIAVRNDGNTDVNLTINGTANSTFLDGTGAIFRWNSSAPGADDGCINTGDNRGNRTGTELSFLGAKQIFCHNLTYPDSRDTTNISIIIGLPPDTQNSTKTAVVEITATCRYTTC